MTDIRHEPQTGAGWGWIMAWGIVSVLVGIVAFAAPVVATLTAAVVIGIFFLISGAFSVVAGLAARGSESRLYAILLGIVSVIAGLIMVFDPATGALSLTIIVAAWLFVRGALELALGFRMRRRRGLMIALGIVNVLLAIFIIATVPTSALTLPGYLLAISFLFGGVTSIVAASDHRTGAAAFSAPV